MIPNIIGAAVAAAVGFLIAFINYTFSKKVLVNTPDRFPVTFVVRQFLQVAYLVVVYIIGSKTAVADLMYLLIGAAVGMTIPTIFFTKKLLALNELGSLKNSGKEGENDG